MNKIGKKEGKQGWIVRRKEGKVERIERRRDRGKKKGGVTSLELSGTFYYMGTLALLYIFPIFCVCVYDTMEIFI